MAQHSIPDPGKQAQRTGLLWVGVALVMVGFWSLWRWQTDRVGAALRSLPESERSALYLRTIDTLRGVCQGERRAVLADFCRQQAELVLQLPECDQACQQLAALQSPRPTR